MDPQLAADGDLRGRFRQKAPDSSHKINMDQSIGLLHESISSAGAAFDG
jgi:hypothetical protein